MDWSAEEWRSAFRIELRVQAIGLASRGWPVLPGTFPTGSGWSGRTGSAEGGTGGTGTEEAGTGPTPVQPDWSQRAGLTPDDVSSWWAQQPYSLLVATGSVLDAVEVDAVLGRHVAAAMRWEGFPVPIVAAPNGRWFFLTESGSELSPELADSGRVRLHGSGSWLALPPSPCVLSPGDAVNGGSGVMHWRVKPEVCGWRLPTAEYVHNVLWASIEAHGDVVDLVTTGSSR